LDANPKEKNESSSVALPASAHLGAPLRTALTLSGCALLSALLAPPAQAGEYVRDTDYAERTMSVDTTSVSQITRDTTQPGVAADSQKYSATDPLVTGSLYAQCRYKWVRSPNVYYDPIPQFPTTPVGAHNHTQSCPLSISTEAGTTTLAEVSFGGHQYSLGQNNGVPNPLNVPGDPQWHETVDGSTDQYRTLMYFSVGVNLNTEAQVSVSVAGKTASASAGTAHAATVNLVMTNPAPAQ